MGKLLAKQETIDQNFSTDGSCKQKKKSAAIRKVKFLLRSGFM